MPQYDLYHNTVKNALIKDGWAISADPFIIEFKGLRLYADLGAEKVLAAEKSGEKIVVEIKVFNSLSLVTELEKAVGQYSIYSTFLTRSIRNESSTWPSLRTCIKISFCGLQFRKLWLISRSNC